MQLKNAKQQETELVNNNDNKVVGTELSSRSTLHNRSADLFSFFLFKNEKKSTYEHKRCFYRPRYIRRGKQYKSKEAGSPYFHLALSFSPPLGVTQQPPRVA